MFPGGRSQNMQPGGQTPNVQYPGMYYGMNNPASNPTWPPNKSTPADDGRDLLAESYERMRNEMRSLQGTTKPDAPPPPSMDSSKDNVAIKMLLNNDNVSLSSLLEAAMDPSSGSNKGTEDPIMKKTILDKCEGKIAQLYRHRISGMGTFFPIVPPKGTKANSSSFLVFHHPRIEFNMKDIGSVWNYPEVDVEAGQNKKTYKVAVSEPTANSKRDKSPAREAAEVYANKPNTSPSTNALVNNEPIQLTVPPTGQIPVIGPTLEVALVDLTRPPPPITKFLTEPPPDPYATTAFELWADIERERRHKEKLKEWELLNEKHKEKDERKKKKKKRHKHSRSRSRSRRRSRSHSGSRIRPRERRRSRRRTKSISLSPSPSRNRSRSPRHTGRRRYSRSPQRSPPRHFRPSPRSSLISPTEQYGSRLPHGPPMDEWSASSPWPQTTSNVPPTSEYHQHGSNQLYSEGGELYNQPYNQPPYNIPPNQYGAYPSFTPRGYPMGGQPGEPHMWGPRDVHPYGYRPPIMDVRPSHPLAPTAKETNTIEFRNLNRNPSNLSSRKRRNSLYKCLTTADSSTQKPTDSVIILDDDKETDVNEDLKTSDASVDHPPGVSPERELPNKTDRESEFTKPLRAKFREMLKPFEKILDLLRTRQRDSFEYKALIKGLEIGTCEFDGVFTLIDGILCRVVMDAAESKKTCFKIVLSPVHVTPVLMEIHKLYHDYSSSKIKRTIDDLFYDNRNFQSWKIGNIIAICKQCKAEAGWRKKKDEKDSGQRKSTEKDEKGVGDQASQSKSSSWRRRSASKGRGDKKQSRQTSKDDRKDVRDKTDKGDSHRGKKPIDTTQKGGVVSSKRVDDSSKRKHNQNDGVSADDNNKSRKIDSASAETQDVEMDDNSKNTTNKLENAKSTSPVKNSSEIPVDSSEKTDKTTAPDYVPTDNLEGPTVGSAPDKNSVNSGPSSVPQNAEEEPVEPNKTLKKLLIPNVVNKNKPEDFKLRVRTAQLSVEDLKTLITSLEGPDKSSADSSYLLKAGMLCKRVTADDGKTEVKIAVTPQTLLKMVLIVHTMAATHAPLEKTITVFNKHFTPIRGVQEAVSIVLNNCEVCKSF